MFSVISAEYISRVKEAELRKINTQNTFSRNRSKAIMFERILQEITEGRNLVIDNEKIPTAIDSALLLDEINQSFWAFSIDLKEAREYLDSDKKFAEYIVGQMRVSLHSHIPEKKSYNLSDIDDITRELVIEKKENPVFVISNAESGIGHDMFYDLISIMQGMFQDNMIRHKNYGFQSVIMVGNHITDDLLSEHEYGHVYRKPWVSGELYHQL